jgi:hypothetical protein
VKTLPSKETLLAFQARWLKPAGLCAIAGSLIFAAAIVIQQVGVEHASTDAESLQLLHDHTTKLVAGQILQSFGFLLFVVPLYVLFKSAAGRSERVRTGLLPIVLIGPPLFLIATTIVAFSSSSVADDYAQQLPAKEHVARERAVAAQAAFEKSQGQTPPDATTTGQTTTGGTTTTQQGESKPKTPDQAAEDAREDLADDVSGDSTILQVGSGLRVTATLALVFALIYTPLWSMRTGLLTRLVGSVGMGVGIALLLVPLLGPVGIVFWFSLIGLMFAGWSPSPLPPAWAAGEAIPWLRSDEDIGPPVERPPEATVEGSGREVSDSEEFDEQGLPRSLGETQGQRRKKRKRRG